VSVEFGVFGGSFDPPHLAHTLLAAYALNAYALERVLIVPTHAHALGKRLAPFEQRLQMCEFAFADLQRVEISSIERDLPTPSFTLSTLEALARRYPGVQLRLLIGADIVAEAHAWHQFDRAIALAPLIVIEREGEQRIDASQPALPDISSSEIRRRLRMGESTRGWLCPRVEDYVRSHGLYTVE
jgi:nicotinate-nucleotide adenylyltransferase